MTLNFRLVLKKIHIPFHKCNIIHNLSFKVSKVTIKWDGGDLERNFRLPHCPRSLYLIVPGLDFHSSLEILNEDLSSQDQENGSVVI